METTTATQRQLVRLLDDKTKFETEGGKVVLDLRPIVIQIGDQVAVIGRVAERLPDSAGKITIIDESQLETAQTITRILRAVADWMWIIALAVAALAIWLARGRRRIELRALAIGVLAVGLLMLVVRRAAGGYLVDQLAKDDSVKPAVQDAWNILTQTLSDRAWVWIILGVVALAGVWFVGETRRAGQARRAAQPILENRRATYGIAAGSVLVLALIAPLFTRGWATSLVLLALVIAGVEVVRTIVQREADDTRRLRAAAYTGAAEREGALTASAIRANTYSSAFPNKERSWQSAPSTSTSLVFRATSSPGASPRRSWISWRTARFECSICSS